MIFRLLLIVILTACASKKERIDKTVPSDLYQYENKDFKNVKQKKYNLKEDRNIFEDKDIVKSSLLALESLQKGKLYKEDLLSSNLSDLAVSCYSEDFNSSISQIKSMREAYKTNVIFWNQVGSCYLLQKKYRKALLFFNKGLEVKPNYGPILNNIGVMYEMKGEHAKSLVAYKRAIKRDRYARTPKYNLAILFLKYGLAVKANPILRGLSSLKGFDKDVLGALAVSYSMLGNHKSAINVYEKIKKDLDERPLSAIHYSLSLFLSGNKKEAYNIIDDVDLDREEKHYSYYKEVKKIIGDN